MDGRAQLEQEARAAALAEGPVAYAILKMFQKVDIYPGDADFLQALDEARALQGWVPVDSAATRMLSNMPVVGEAPPEGDAVDTQAVTLLATDRMARARAARAAKREAQR